MLKSIREVKNNTPTIFITSLSDVDSLEKAFDLGCDDYIKKPFELQELKIRINHIKKQNNIESNDIIQIDQNYTYDYLNSTILCDDKKITLSTKESKVLEYLLKNKNRTISFDEIKSNIWNYDETPTDATIRTYIKNLRKVLGENMIVTIKGMGYKFES